MGEEAKHVQVGVLLAALPEKNACVVITEDGRGVDFVTGKDESTKSFLFDLVTTGDNIQGIYSNLLHPLVESVLKGYTGTLLIHGASTEKTGALIDQNIIKQILINLLQGKMQEKEDFLVALSFIQFYPDGTSVDALNPNRESLKPVTHPFLGRIAGGVSELCISSPEEAYNLYETCRDRVKSSPGGLSCRCSTLLSVAVEWRSHSAVCRSRLQLFSLAGGASRTDLRGVSPLVKALDQIQSEVSPEDKLLPFLLKETLSGNSRTTLLCCLHPQGFLDNETPNALTLAQKVRSLVTKPTVIHWCPRAAEQDIRDKMAALRTEVMSEGGSDIHNTYRLAQLNQDLQVVKSQSWERRQEQSNKIKDIRKQDHQSCNSTRFSGDNTEISDMMKHLQDQLRFEMHKHIQANEHPGGGSLDQSYEPSALVSQIQKPGDRSLSAVLQSPSAPDKRHLLKDDAKGDPKIVQEQIGRIQHLREALREETVKRSAAIDNPDICSQSQLEYNKAHERRRRQQEDHGRLIQEEVEKMERELAQEQHPTEGPQRELLVLTKERRVLVLQLEALRAEAQQAEHDLSSQHQTHQMEMNGLRQESLQVFRVFREVCEEQRKMSEARYRTVLLEAVQDAVYLSAQNQQLQAETKELSRALAELKDTLAAQGGTKVELV